MNEEIKSKKIEGNFIVLKKTSQDMEKGHWTYIALIDRNKSKKHWWTVNKDMAMKFALYSAAKKKAEELKYGSFKVIELKEWDKFIGMEFWRQHVMSDSLTKQLAAHENQWHDDDWNEASAGSGICNGNK